MGDSNATDDETAAALAELLGELPDRLRDEADAAVADARDADDLVERLAALSERAAGDAGADETVAEASSVADLRADLDAAVTAGGGDAGASADTAGEAADEVPGDGDGDDDGVFGRVRSTLDGVRDRVAGDDADTDAGDVNAAPTTAAADADETGAEGVDAAASDETRADAEGDDGDGDGVDIAVAENEEADDGSPVYTGIERSRELASDARSASASLDRDALPSLDREALPMVAVDRDRTRDVVRAARDRAGAGADELRRTVRNADPKQAAVWGLATGVTVANPAIAASYSTAALLSGAVLGGSAVGMYASSHDDTVFDDLEPMMMARQANAGASAGRGARNVDGKSVGAMLGASAYLARELTPEAYAHWVAEADAETVLRGADMGAGRAAASDAVSGPRSGAALGGGLGLLYGMASDDSDGDGDDGELRELLDDDRWAEDAGRLAGDEDVGAERVETRPVDEDEDGHGVEAEGDDADVTIPDAETGDDATADGGAEEAGDEGDGG